MITRTLYNNKYYSSCIEFLRNEYLENKNENSWLAQRFEDMEFRIDVLHVDKKGKPSWHKQLMIWEDDKKIVAILTTEGTNEVWMNIHNGYEYLFTEMMDYAEKNIAINGKLSVFANTSQKYKNTELIKRGYIKKVDKEEISFLKKIKCKQHFNITIPEGFKLICGTHGLNHKEILNACHYGFSPQCEGEEVDTGELSKCWLSREKAPMFKYDYEVIVKAPNGETASYSYVWVDEKTSTGYIEPVSTRLKYRRLGLGKACQLAILNLLKDIKVDYCFVNPYGETRNLFYSSCGYKTFDKEYEYVKENNN